MFCAFHDVAEGKAGFETGDAGQAGQLVLVQTSIVFNAGDAGDEHVVVLAGHEMAADNAFRFTDGSLEGGQHRRRLALQSNTDEDSHALAEERVVDQRAVAANGSRGLKSLDAARGSGGRKADRFADLVVGSAAVALQMAQNGLVQFIQAAASRPGRVSCRGFKVLNA